MDGDESAMPGKKIGNCGNAGQGRKEGTGSDAEKIVHKVEPKVGGLAPKWARKGNVEQNARKNSILS